MTVLAVVLGALSAVLFSVSGVLQHRAVGRTSTLTGLVRRPLWLAGASLAGTGSLVHAVALGLAPIAVVQPVGVLAVPLGVLAERWFAARDRRSGAPDRGGLGRWAVAGLVAAVVGVGVVVGVTTGSATAGPVDPGRLLLTCVVLGGLALIPAGLSTRAGGTVRCLARAVPAAIAFGLVSGLLRAGLTSIATGAAPMLVVGIAAGLLVLLAAGAAGVQLAYRSGPPSLVLACLTVVDPIVAVTFGVSALGERVGTAPQDVLLAGAGALLAATGVALLARHHPDARARAAEGPGPTPHDGDRPAPTQEPPAQAISPAQKPPESISAARIRPVQNPPTRTSPTQAPSTRIPPVSIRLEPFPPATGPVGSRSIHPEPCGSVASPEPFLPVRRVP